MNSDRRLFAHELEKKLDTLLFASPSHRSISRLAHLLEALPRSRQDKVLHWAGIAARTYAEIGYLIATLVPQAFDVLGDEGFEAWVLAGLNTYDKEGLRPAMERLRNLEALRAERAGLRAAYFADVEPRLTRWVRGLSGRYLALKAGENPGPIPKRSTCHRWWLAFPTRRAIGNFTKRCWRCSGLRRVRYFPGRFGQRFGRSAG